MYIAQYQLDTGSSLDECARLSSKPDKTCLLSTTMHAHSSYVNAHPDRPINCHLRELGNKHRTRDRSVPVRVVCLALQRLTS